MFLSNVSTRRPVLTAVAFIVIMVVGLLCYTLLPINDMPQADFPYVTVTVMEPGASPDQLESKVTKKIEDAIGQIAGVKHISSSINDNVSMTVVEFDLDKSPDVAAQEVKDKISTIRMSLPSDIKEPVIAKFDFMAMPIFSLVLTGDVNKKDLSTLVDDVIVKKLNTISGVGSITTYGAVEREVQVKLDKQKLEAYGVTTSDVINGLKSDNMDIPSGKVGNSESEISLTTSSSVKDISDFSNILVKTVHNTEIRLGDVAEIVDGLATQDSASYYNGKEAIGIDIVKQSGSNTVTVADTVRTEINNIKEQLPTGVSLEIVRDNSQSIKDSVDEVLQTILEGCFFAILIVFIFLREWQGTLISGISLPTSIIGTFIALRLMNFSLNQMSLMALSLAVGMLVDDAIVVIENIVRHMHMGKSPLQAAKEATTEIGTAVIATTLAVVAVFLPVAMVSGMIGKFFIEFGLTIAFSMLVSLLVSFTLVPMLSSRLLKNNPNKKKFFVIRFLDWVNGFFDFIAKKYQKTLGVVLKNRLISLVIVVGLFLVTMKLIPFIGFEFMPTVDTAELNVSVELDAGLALPNAEKKAKEIENIIKQNKDVLEIYTNVKSSSISIDLKVTDKIDRHKDINQLAQEIREMLSQVPGTVISVGLPSAGGKAVAFNITGDDRDSLVQFANQALDIMRKDPNATDVGISYKAGNPQVKLIVDRDKAADLGVNMMAVGNTLNTLFSGVDVGTFETNKDRYNIRVSVKDSQKENIDSLNDVYVSADGDKMIPLNQVTKKEFSTTASSLHRYDRSIQIEIACNVTGMAQGDFVSKYTKLLQTGLNKPAGIDVSLGGMNQEMQAGMMNLVTALLMGILFIYLVMAAQFESFLTPISIMFALPLAVIGAIIGLFLGNDNFGIMAMIGIIMLMGLVAKNAILLIDFILQKRRAGIPRTEAILSAAITRFRPILMTTLAMIFGMIPAAVAVGSGSEYRGPMAHAVIGGLITSTLLTLFVVPIIYTMLDDFTGLFRKAEHLKHENQNNGDVPFSGSL